MQPTTAHKRAQYLPGLQPPAPVTPTSVPENSELSSISFILPSLGPRS